jgi:assimilatory nitrate reductase catalytic subunit
MTRTGLSPKLGGHLPEPFVEVNPWDAEGIGLEEAGFARVASGHGSGIFRVRVTDTQRRGSLFIPIHWSDATASSARTGDLVAPNVDPFSGQPEAKATPASIAPISFAYGGFVVARGDISLPQGTWWARVALEGGKGLLIASNDGPAHWRARIPSLLGEDAEVAEYIDESRGVYRVAVFVGDVLEFCLFLGPREAPPHWDAISALIAAHSVGSGERRAILSGRRTDGIEDPGPIVCACFGVGLAAIRKAISSGDAVDVTAIGALLKAGTNCGSCLPDLKRILADERIADPV